MTRTADQLYQRADAARRAICAGCPREPGVVLAGTCGGRASHKGADSGYLHLPRVRVLGLEEIAGFNKPGSGYYFHSCARVADYDDPTPEADGHSVLSCDGDYGWEGIEAYFRSWMTDYVEIGRVFNLSDVRWFDHATHGPVLFHTPQWYIYRGQA